MNLKRYIMRRQLTYRVNNTLKQNNDRDKKVKIKKEEYIIIKY